MCSLNSNSNFIEKKGYWCRMHGSNELSALNTVAVHYTNGITKDMSQPLKRFHHERFL